MNSVILYTYLQGHKDFQWDCLSAKVSEHSCVPLKTVSGVLQVDKYGELPHL